MSVKLNFEKENQIYLGYFNNKRDFIIIVVNVLLYGILDLTSTILGIYLDLSKEHNPFLIYLILEDNWVLIFILVKVILLIIFFLHYKITNKMIGQYILLILSVYLTIGKILWYSNV